MSGVEHKQLLVMESVVEPDPTDADPNGVLETGDVSLATVHWVQLDRSGENVESRTLTDIIVKVRRNYDVDDEDRTVQELHLSPAEFAELKDMLAVFEVPA